MSGKFDEHPSPKCCICYTAFVNLNLFDCPYTQYHDSPPALLPDLTGELQGAGGGTEEGWGAVNGGHERLGQPPLLKVVG